jgi:hypothetical protein
MVKNILLFYITTCSILSCKQKEVTVPQQPVSQLNNSFFPVTQYILGQLNELDTLPVTPLKITNINGTLDSVWLKRKDIRSFAQPFLSPIIDSISCYKYFSEESFLDQTINAFTISYYPINKLPDSIILKRWDIYVDPDYNTVKRIFIVKQLNDIKISQTIQLTWKPGYHCKIITISQEPGIKPKIKEEQLIWNFNQ